jgi:hypothetical protein
VHDLVGQSVGQVGRRGRSNVPLGKSDRAESAEHASLVESPDGGAARAEQVAYGCQHPLQDLAKRKARDTSLGSVEQRAELSLLSLTFTLESPQLGERGVKLRQNRLCRTELSAGV